MGALAQREVTGRVTSQSDGLPIPGVNVSEKGTTNGTITDMEGTYTLTVSQDEATLVFSFIGMETQEVLVNGLTTINVNLAESAFQMDEVVVTALGIKRQEKTLTYAQQTVGADELLKARDPNFMNSLSGKASGVEIKKSSSGAGGSTKIELRGSKSLSGTSDPLFVIDGIPMANNKGGQPGMWGGTDQGDGLSQINPDDIESLTILKGSNAAALYGSQGANGVVVITTKKGKQGSAKVSVSSGLTFESILLKPDLQYKYGSTGGAKESWSYTPGDYASNYVDDFFQTGTNAVNTVSISGGNDRTTAYFSYGNTSAKGIVPTNTYMRNNVTLKQSTKLFNDKLTISSNVMLTAEKAKNRQPAGYYLNPLTGLYFFPRDKDFSDYKDNYQVFDEDRNMYLQNWFISDHHQSNPYWLLHKQPKTDNTKRLIANVVLNYEISDALKFQVRGNYDFANKSFEQQHAAGSNTTNVHKNGRWDYQKYTDELMYTDGILTFDKTFGNFSLNGVAGASYQKYTYGKGISVNTGTEGLLYPNEFFFQNIAFNVQVNSTLGSRLIKEAVFANAQVGYKDMIYFDVSGRNDWASSLAGTGNQSYFYPALGVTALVNEMVDLPSFVTFGKLRASWSQVGNEVPFNKVDPQNTITSGGGISRNTTKPFTDLKPEMISSFEVGADWRFLNGRLGFDLTYYDITSTDQFVQLEAPSGSGYTYYYVNAGEINNNGIELSIDATPVKNSNFSWKTAINYSKNNNEVVEIHPQVSGLSTGSSEGYDNKFVEGGSIGDIYVYKFRRDDQGRILLSDATGAPLKTSTTEKIGNLNPDWSMGWSNNLNYKNLSLGFLINSKIGGKAVSQTEAMLDGYGVTQRTADARDAGSVSINGVTESGTAVSSIDPKLYYTTTGDRNGIKEPYTYDRTNIRISQVSLSYSFDVKKMNLPIDNATLSFVGQNLLFLYKDAPFDPELVMNTGSSYQSLDNFNLPATRTYGFNLQVTF
jgi:TonB-linked SusC/RagA family outer membrane protein